METISHFLNIEITDTRGILKIMQDINGLKFEDKNGKKAVAYITKTLGNFLSDIQENPEDVLFTTEKLGIKTFEHLLGLSGKTFVADKNTIN